MTQDEIIEIAEQAGMTQDGDMWFSNGKEDMDVEHKHLVAFANLVAAKEREALAQPEQEPVAWLQFKDNEPPVVAPRNLGTPVFLGIRGGLAHDAQSKEQL